MIITSGGNVIVNHATFTPEIRVKSMGNCSNGHYSVNADDENETISIVIGGGYGDDNPGVCDLCQGKGESTENCIIEEGETYYTSSHGYAMHEEHITEVD